MDSLGAVLLVRALSDSLGGVRIKLERMFRAGVTVRSFADELYAQLLEENPEVIKKLGILPSGDVESAADILIDDDGVDEMYEAAFGEQVASNLRLIQGIRGCTWPWVSICCPPF